MGYGPITHFTDIEACKLARKLRMAVYGVINSQYSYIAGQWIELYTLGKIRRKIHSVLLSIINIKGIFVR